MMILQDHYNYELESELGALLSTQGWEGPFQVASIWAKRALGRRLHKETVEQARAHIVAGMGGSRGEEVVTDARLLSSSLSIPLPPVAAPPPLQTANNTENTSMDKHIITVQTHPTPKHPEPVPTSPIPPKMVQKVSVGRAAEESGGWSPVREENLLHIPAQDNLPRPQRDHRLTHLPAMTTSSPRLNPCCVVETDSIIDDPTDTDLLIDLGEPELVPLPHTAESGAKRCDSTPVEDAGKMTRRLRTAVQSQLSVGLQQTPQQPYSPQPVTRRATRHIRFAAPELLILQTLPCQRLQCPGPGLVSLNQPPGKPNP